jgi:lysozyme
VRCSDAGIALIKEFEGFQPQLYDDLGGKPTVGYGHLVRSGESFSRLSESEATSLLCADLVTAEACIEDCVDVALTQNQFDALCSFVFNLGCLKLRGSTLLRYLNKGAYDLAANEFEKWCKCGQNQVDGLLRRRLAEKLLFETP